MSLKTNGSTFLRSMILLATLVGGVALILSLPRPSVRAASTYTVNSLADTDDGACDAANCTLREAMTASNFDPVSTINFSVTGTITLTSALPSILNEVTINGPGSSQLTVSGDNSVRVFYVEGAGTVATISGLTISNGNGDGYGGGILLDAANGMLTVSTCVVTGNSSGGGSGGGGGIAVVSGTIHITNSTITGNSGVGGGGGLKADTGELVTISNSTISGNSAVGIGGGIEGPIVMRNCTVTGNTASCCGGGIAGSGFQIANSTISDNSAPLGSGVQGSGSLSSNIIALNTGGGNDVSNNDPILSGGYNAIGTSDGVTWTPTDQVGVTAAQLKLGALTNNGGPTESMALSCGSVAIDKGRNASASTTDQRDAGFARTFDDPSTANAVGGDGTDVGAFEVQAACAVPPTNKDQCKNNGWKTLSRANSTPFKNQGDCIQYVNTGR